VLEMQQLIASVSLFDKILIFCTTIDIIESLTRELSSLLYYAKLANKNNILRQFDRSKCRIIVAITTLSLKLNKPDIDLIVYVSYFFNLLNYAQESKQDRQNRQECYAVIVQVLSKDFLSID